MFCDEHNHPNDHEYSAKSGSDLEEFRQISNSILIEIDCQIAMDIGTTVPKFPASISPNPPRLKLFGVRSERILLSRMCVNRNLNIFKKLLTWLGMRFV